MEFVTIIITSVVESLKEPIKKHLNFWASSRKYVEDMDARMTKLNAAARAMEKRQETNTSKNLEVPDNVTPWLEEVIKINEDVKGIPKGGTGCCNIKMRYKAGKDSSGIVEKIKRLEEWQSEFVWTNEEISLARVPSKGPSTSTPVVDDGTQISYESRDLIFREALKSLSETNNSNTQMIALCGMGGIGKTTMMEKLEKVAVNSREFKWVVRAVVGRTTDPNAFQQAVAEKMGGPVTESTRDSRADRLKNRFAGMSLDGKNKILLILDDVWGVVDLKDIGLTSPLPNGFKLLLTSRDEYVCTQMGVEPSSIFKIGPLNDVEAKDLFFETVGLSEEDDPDLYMIGEGIIKRCGNLPIALKTIAASLKGDLKDESEWEEALSRLKQHDLQDHYNIVHKVFEISYKYLKAKEQQAVFLLSGLFPDDSDIPMEELMRCGWGLRLFSTEVNTCFKARRRVKTCIHTLISANLLTESDRVGCVEMHDLARSFVLSNFAEVKQASIVNHDDMSEQLRTKDANESYQRILLKCTGMSEFPLNFNYPNLEFLKLMDGNDLLKFPDELYEKMEKIQVISYEQMQYPLFPKSLQFSPNLTTLSFHGCELVSDYSLVGDLLNLEMLSFADCRIKKLPSTIGKLKKLKLLDLTGCFELSIDDGVFGNFKNLEELYMRVYGWKAIRFTDASCVELEKLSMNLFALEVEFFENQAQPKNMSFTKLERFKISIGCLLLEDNKDIYSFKNTLKLVTNIRDLLGCKINELFKRTEILHLQVKDMKHLKDVSMPPLKNSFSKLRVLDVVECADLKYLFTIHMASGLRKLERLSVSVCPVLESLIQGESEIVVHEAIKFQELKYLSLNKLPKLASLCDINNVVELPQLVELRLGDLPNFTSIFPDNDDATKPFLKEVAIPKLEKLKIFSMENLKQIWPCEITTTSEEVHMSLLKVVKVQDCVSFVNLFPTNPMHLLLNLKKLQVKKCASIEVLFNIDLGRIGKFEEVRSGLRSIHVVDSLKLTEVWRIKGDENKTHPVIRGFQAVENIHIHGCMRFRNVFTPRISNFDMRALVDIRMEDSRNLLFHEALKSLDPNKKTNKIALCGMAGIGKTTMMEQLKRAVVDSKMFDLVVTANIGSHTNPIIFQSAIADETGECLTEKDKGARADRLHNRFMEISQYGQKKILVILDDVWEVINLKDIGLPGPLPNGFKLLITSQNEQVCKMMGVENNSIFTLSLLGEPEAKVFFYEMVGTLDGDPELHKIAQDIVKSCHGMPLLIKWFAYDLRGKQKVVWEDAVSRLNNNDHHAILSMIFSKSFSQLETEDDKAIFLLSGLFPGEADIPIEDLVRYGWGLNLFSKLDSLARARQQTKTCLDMLVLVNLLMKSDCVGSFKMHQLVRRFVLGYFTEVKQAVIDRHDMLLHLDVPFDRIILNCTGRSKFPLDFNHHPNLTFLKLMGDKNPLMFPQDFYDRMEKLEVIAYERIDNPLLPQYSTKLRTLGLDSCSLSMDDFSFLGNLINLEILSFAHCHIRKLPSRIGNLRKLKVLDVTGCVDLCIDDGVFQNLVNLEELYMRVHGSKAIHFTDANCKELEILSRQLCALEVELYEQKLQPKNVSFEKLERFKISMGRLLNENNIDPFGNTLKLVTNRRELLECKINDMFKKTQNLYLQVKDLNNLEQISMQYSFCDLSELEVSDCEDLTFLFTIPVASGLTKLERLTISSCPVLEAVVHGESGDETVIKFKELKFLSLNELPNLMSLSDTDNGVELQQLVELRLGGLPNFATIFPHSDAMQKPFFNKEVKIPNIKKLKISSMEKLKQIWGCEITSREDDFIISMLKQIEVEECDRLVNLFPCNPLPLLNHLEELKVKNCGSIQVLFNIDLRNAGNTNEVRSSLRSIRVERLGELREMWRIKGANNSRLLIRGFQAVENIHIHGCTRFRNVFTPNNTNFDMRALVKIDD